MATDIHVKGLADLQKFLDELAPKIEANVMRQALRAGCKPIMLDEQANAPVGPASSSGAKKYGLHAGSLRDSIRITTRRKGGTVSASVVVGGKGKWGNVWYAHIIEYTGAVAHTIKARTGHALSFGGKLYASIDHPGMNPKPFVRAALDHEANNAVVAAAEYIKKRLATKQGLDTSEVLIEGDQP